MGSLNTKIMVWNMALDLLREQPLAATTDEKATAKATVQDTGITTTLTMTTS